MGRYRILVATGASLFAGSHNRVQLWLVGARGETELELQLRPARGQKEEFEHEVPEDLGPLQFVKLRKHHSLVDDAWFCDHITVRGPGACEEAAFPCYHWVQGDGVLCLPEATGEGQCREEGCTVLMSDKPVFKWPSHGIWDVASQTWTPLKTKVSEIKMT